MAFYCKDRKTFVNTDASSYGLGAYLYQINEDGEQEIISFDSRTLMESEKLYAPIEKEALAIAWACEKYDHFINVIHITIETDHKPLLQILKTKFIDTLTPRLQKSRIRLMKYSYDMKYVKGCNQQVSDCLSRAPIVTESKDETIAFLSAIVL